MNQYERYPELESPSRATSDAVENISDHYEEDDDDDMSTSTDDSQMKIEIGHKGTSNDDISSGMKWDRSRSRRYNLEMLREYEQKRTQEIISRMLEMYKSNMMSKCSQSDEEDDEGLGAKYSGPDPRGIYARIESQWRSEHSQVSPPRQLTSSSERTFFRKTSSVLAAARFKSNKKTIQRHNSDKS